MAISPRSHILAAPLFVLALLPASAAVARAGNGDPVGGLPTYFERAMLALTNACRQGPQTYRDTHLPAYPTILLPQNHPAVPAVYWNLALNQSAHAHALDMATNNCFQQNSCNGTPWNTRIASYYTESGGYGENIGAGLAAPFASFNNWIIDGGFADKTAQAFHRSLIMNPVFNEMGNGYAFNAAASFDHYWVQDFGTGPADFTTPLVWGSHVLTGDGNITFLANYHASGNDSPQEALLVLDGEIYSMTAQFGTTARGTYRAAVPIAAGCRTYFFQFRDAGGTVWRQPEGGVLRTAGVGGCAEDYLPATATVPGRAPESLDLRLAPNPATAAAMIRFRAPGADATIRLYDLAGRRVRDVHPPRTGDEVVWTWDGRDDDGRRAQAGVYLVRAGSGRFEARGRLVWIPPVR